MRAAIKGAYFINGVRALQEAAGPDLLTRVASTLSPAAQEMIAHPPSAADWISFETRMEIFTHVIENVLKATDVQVEALGRSSYIGTFGTVYKTFIKMFSPEFVMSRSRTMWNQSMRDCGSITEVGRGPTHVELAYQKMPHVRPWYWSWTKGGLLGIAELTRVRKPNVAITSGAGLSDSCTFRVSWER